MSERVLRVGDLLRVGDVVVRVVDVETWYDGSKVLTIAPSSVRVASPPKVLVMARHDT